MSESTRPDAIQIFHTLSEGLKLEGADVNTGLAGKIKEYNALSSVQSQNISELEGRVILSLPFQTEKFRSMLKYHWQNYKNAESAVPMKMFLQMDADVPPEATGVWKEILSPSAEKNETFLQMLVAIYTKNIKDAMRMIRKVNLRFGAAKLRVADTVMAYRQCCLWVHFRKEMMAEMSADEYAHMERVFARGAFDRELTDRVRAMNPTLKLADFRFFYLHLGREQPLKEDAQLNADQEEAELQQEQAGGRKARNKFLRFQVVGRVDTRRPSGSSMHGSRRTR